MKKDELFDGVTDIDGDLIEEAAARRKKRPGWRQFWDPALAAAVAVVLALCVGAAALWSRGLTQPSRRVYRPDGPVRTLAAAVYPEQVPYEAYIENLERYRGAWYEQQTRRKEALEDYGGELDGFFRAVTAQFLSGGGEDNRVCSPLNLYMALAMLAQATGGETREEILDLLGAESIEALRAQVGAVWNGTYQDDGAVAAILGNSLWLRQDTDYVKSAVNTLAKDYYASVYRGDMGSAEMNRALREWIDTQTGGLLTEQAGQLELDPGAALALASTIYFKERWDEEFYPQDTEPRVFHAPGGDVTCDFMYGKEVGCYYRGAHFLAVRKQFRNDSGGMWFLLPDEGVEAEALLRDEEALWLLSGGADVGKDREQIAELWITMPKFDVCATTGLTEGLKALGVSRVFDPARADFSPLMGNSGGVSLDVAEHAARVLVDEEGCTGAAYTFMAPLGDWGHEDRIDITLDRPFLFSVISEGGLPLFVGVVKEP